MNTPGPLQSNEAMVSKGGFITPQWFRPLQAAMAALFNTWESVRYEASKFTGSGSMTWTVDEADVTTLVYRYHGSTMTVFFVLAGTTVGGTPSTALRIAIPRGLSAKRTIHGVYRADDNGTVAAALCKVTDGDRFIEFFRNIAGTGNWAAGTSGVSGQMTFEVTD